MDDEKERWTVDYKKVVKQAKFLPLKIKFALEDLLEDLEEFGPIQKEWPNFSELRPGEYHCHLDYHWVAVWECKDKRKKHIEVTYAGSREKAPYNKNKR
jgi:mRNA-degrading endonuclease YafQ of YafQ-DinJ toxin-antitoxin module